MALIVFIGLSGIMIKKFSEKKEKYTKKPRRFSTIKVNSLEWLLFPLRRRIKNNIYFGVPL